MDMDHFGNKFSVINMGQALMRQVPSYGHWNVQLFQRQPSLVKFNYTFPLGSSIGVYGSRNRSPSHTKYDFMEIIGVGTSKRTIRSKDLVNTHHSSKQLQSAEFYQYLDQGNWFISTFNDAAQPIDISFVILYAGRFAKISF
jgi:teneurin-3